MEFLNANLISFVSSLQGIPKHLRGKVWRFLLQQRRNEFGFDSQSATVEPVPDYSYEDLLNKLASHQHAILVDLGECHLALLLLKWEDDMVVV